MLKPKKKATFSEIWKLIKQADTNAGIFLFKDPSEKLTKREKFLKLRWPESAFLVVLLNVSTLIITRFALINIIFSCSVLTIVFGVVYMVLVKMIVDERGLKDLFNWCESLYDVEKTFNKVVHGMADKNLLVIE